MSDLKVISHCAPTAPSTTLWSQLRVTVIMLAMLYLRGEEGEDGEREGRGMVKARGEDGERERGEKMVRERRGEDGEREEGRGW